MARQSDTDPSSSRTETVMRRGRSATRRGDTAASWGTETEMHLQQCSSDANDAVPGSRKSTTASNHLERGQDVSVQNIASTLLTPQQLGLTESSSHARPSLMQRAERIARYFRIRSESEPVSARSRSMTPEGYRSKRDVGGFTAHNIRKTLKRGLDDVSRRSYRTMQPISPLQEQTAPNVTDGSSSRPDIHSTPNQSTENNPSSSQTVVSQGGLCPPHVGCPHCSWCLHHGHCSELGSCRHEGHSTYHGNCAHTGPCSSVRARNSDCPIDREVTNSRNIRAPSYSHGESSHVRNLQQAIVTGNTTAKATASTRTITATRAGTESSQTDSSSSQEQLSRWINPQQVPAGEPFSEEQMTARSAHRQLLSNLRDQIQQRLRLLEELGTGVFRDSRGITQTEFDDGPLIPISADEVQSEEGEEEI